MSLANHPAMRSRKARNRSDRRTTRRQAVPAATRPDRLAFDEHEAPVHVTAAQGDMNTRTPRKNYPHAGPMRTSTGFSTKL